MATTFTIDGVDKASVVNWKSIEREEVLTKEPNTLRFRLLKHPGRTYKPDVGDEVVVTANSIKEFGGYIVEMNETIDGMVEYISCICKDYSYSLDRYLVSKTYEDMTVNDIIADLIATFADGLGFTTNNVDCSTVLPSVQFNYLTISKCLEKLTTIVGDFQWNVDYNKDIHFFPSSVMAATYNLTDTSANYVFDSLYIREDTHQLRNYIIIRGGLLTSDTNRVELLVGDNTKKIFPLATKFASRPAVSINGSSITVGIENLEPESSYQVMWDYNQKSLRFATALTTGTTSVTAPYQYPLVLEKSNDDSIATYGVFQHVIIDKTIIDIDTASLRGDVELLKYSLPEKTANFETYTYGLVIGQTINVQSTIRGIDEDFRIQSIRSKFRTPNTDELVHSVECVTAEDVGINDILALLLIKNPSDLIDVSADEFIVRIKSVNETLAITDSVSAPTKTSPPYVYDTATWNFSTFS